MSHAMLFCISNIIIYIRSFYNEGKRYVGRNLVSYIPNTLDIENNVLLLTFPKVTK